MAYVKTRDGTDIYVKDWGKGRPIVLLHGWPLAADMWDTQAMALADAGFRATPSSLSSLAWACCRNRSAMTYWR